MLSCGLIQNSEQCQIISTMHQLKIKKIIKELKTIGLKINSELCQIFSGFFSVQK